MKKTLYLGIVASLFVLGGCVESSQKYKDLLARADSLNTVAANQTQEMERMFADINELTEGMQSLRDAEHLLTLEAEKEKKEGNKSKQQLAQLKNDVQALTEAIAGYKEQIAKLESRNKAQSEEFKRMIDNLNAELELRSEKIKELTDQLAATHKELNEKVQLVEHLTGNVDSLNKETQGQKVVLAEQDKAIHSANYLIGSRKELKQNDVIYRRGMFCPPIVSSQAQKAGFVNIDIRETKTIPLNNKRAKILSVHPDDSYTLEAGEDGNLVLKINDENSFWKQTRYLVIMVG